MSRKAVFVSFEFLQLCRRRSCCAGRGRGQQEAEEGPCEFAEDVVPEPGCLTASNDTLSVSCQVSVLALLPSTYP
jgi:hypothetical protein